ncbi:uncharacterized protein DNG_03039 [Cephalotrichum gorgonifer]|uniref:Uncharacterized protein n=1 Tax=Cephalotrichum gorgonifer TaxID=2041049 RepID=A0AAE8MV08_9PEZI|nr:uncharacterized protein DNG_03039 [Cephalotrichum gorgonifer]
MFLKCNKKHTGAAATTTTTTTTITITEHKPTMARKFHLRKPKSLDSVSSTDSISTAASDSMPRTPLSPAPSRHTRIVEFDPLSLHPTHPQAPPRLADRAFLRVGDEAKTFQPSQPHREFQMPPVESPNSTIYERRAPLSAGGASDYFPMPMRVDLPQLQRPTLARSRWSDSTTHTLSSEEEDEDDDEESEIEEEQFETATVATVERAPFEVRYEAREDLAYKRNTMAVARMRPRAEGNAIDNYVKRGGWKRRGIVFQNGNEGCLVERLSSQTVG